MTPDAGLIIDLSDTCNGLMAIPNLIGVICCSGLVVRLTRNDVERKIRKNPDVKPLYAFDAEIQQMQEEAAARDGETD